MEVLPSPSLGAEQFGLVTVTGAFLCDRPGEPREVRDNYVLGARLKWIADDAGGALAELPAGDRKEIPKDYCVVYEVRFVLRVGVLAQRGI